MPKNDFTYPTQLIRMFPAIDQEVIIAVLLSVNNDTNAAVQALLQFTEDVELTEQTSALHIETQRQRSITPAQLVEMTSTPIDQLLEDELFAQALQRTLNTDQSSDKGRTQSIPQPQSRPLSATSTLSQLKNKWSILSDKTKLNVSNLYAKMKGRRQETPQRGNFMFVDDADEEQPPKEQELVDIHKRLEQIKSIYPQVEESVSAPSMNTIQRHENVRKSDWPLQPRLMPMEPTLIMNRDEVQDQFEVAPLRAKSKSPEKPLIDFDDF